MSQASNNTAATETVGGPTGDGISARHHPLVAQQLQQAQADGSPPDWDALLKLVSRTYMAIDADARRTGQCMRRLVQHLDQANSQVSQAWELLRTTLNTIRHGVILVDSGGIVQVCNARAIQLLQLPPDIQDRAFDVRHIASKLANAEIKLGDTGDAASLHLSDGQIVEIRHDPLPGGGKVLLVEDMTDQRRREDSLYLAESEYHSLFGNSVCGIYRDRLDGTPVRANRALVTFNGYETEKEYRAAIRLSGGNWYVDPDRPRHFQQLLETHGEVRDLVSEVYRHRTRERRWITENAWYVRDKAGKPVYIEGTIQDATERVQGLAEIERQANIDPLTGAASRFHFMNELNAITRNMNGACVLFIIDLDKFKEVNDMLGHSAGDAVLKAVVTRLRTAAGSSAIVARLGGDEFAVLMTGAAAAMKADMLAAEIVRSLRMPVEVEGYSATVGASVGVALFPAQAANTEELLNHADVALYHVKTNGKNGARIFDHAMKQRLLQRKILEQELREAISTDALELYYQPIVETETASVHGIEALIRWNHPRRGFLPPYQFIDVAEDAGLMTELGNWTIRRACRQASILPRHITVAVNVSPSQFRSSGIIDQVKDALADTGLEASRLTLEVTENVLLSSEAIASRIFDELAGLGVKLALDDFGTGYSSLSYLQRFAFSKVKIDRSFVAGIESKPANAAIIRAIIRLAGDLGMDVVAEGVETEAQASLLKAEGCTFLQGYLFGKPKSYLELSADLATHHLRQHLPPKPPALVEFPGQKRAVHNGL